MDRDLISPDLWPAPELDEPEAPQPPQPAPQQPITVDNLLQHIRLLTDNQNLLIGQIQNLRERAEDPILQFKTPDPIKNLPNFSGNKKETQAWIQDVESTLDLFRRYVGRPMYPQFIRAIKAKIIGEAKEILIASGNPNTWEEIKDALLNSYGDRRDLTSHLQSLFYIKQGKKTLTEFYNKIKAIDTSIKATASTMDDYRGSTKAINNFISLITLTRFIDGLNENVSMHVRSCRPETLEDAYNITMQFTNAAYRTKLNENQFTRVQARTPAQPNARNNIPGTSKQNINPPSANFRQGSGKFKNSRNNNDEDVSMRTHMSRMQVNNHEGKEPENFEQLEPPAEPNDLMDSEDDEVLGDELNFQLAHGSNAQT